MAQGVWDFILCRTWTCSRTERESLFILHRYFHMALIGNEAGEIFDDEERIPMNELDVKHFSPGMS